MAALGIRDAAGWTMAGFGFMAFTMGVVGIASPDTMLAAMMLEVVPADARAPADLTPAFVTASSMAALNMGVYYMLAARADFRAFYRWTVPFRCLTFTVFTIAGLTGRAPLGFVGIGAWELVGALATGWALRRDARAAAPHAGEHAA